MTKDYTVGASKVVTGFQFAIRLAIFDFISMLNWIMDYKLENISFYSSSWMSWLSSSGFLTLSLRNINLSRYDCSVSFHYLSLKYRCFDFLLRFCQTFSIALILYFRIRRGMISSFSILIGKYNNHNNTFIKFDYQFWLVFRYYNDQAKYIRNCLFMLYLFFFKCPLKGFINFLN